MILLDSKQTPAVFRAAWNIVYIYKNKQCSHTNRTTEIFENAKSILRDFYDINEQDVKYYLESSNEEE